MKKIMVVLGLLVSMALISAPSHAFDVSGAKAFSQDTHQATFDFSFLENFFKSLKKKKEKRKCVFFCGKKKKSWEPKKRKSVPEMDAAGAAIALALMGGFVSIMRERRKK